MNASNIFSAPSPIHRIGFTLLTVFGIFIPVETWAAAQPAQENVPGGALMLAAYILLWGFPLGLLWLSHRRLNGVEQEVNELKEMIQSAANQMQESSDPAGAAE